ncbi:MAG: ribonuclease P protein component [Ruminococcus sp.]|nr:ribonuclease P protein component [Ruminococcus sp.]
MKAQTLKKNGDFKRLYSKGKSFVSPALVTYVQKKNNNNLRIGITTSKKIGSAVQRNRCRRIIRAAFSNINEPSLHGADIVFVARTKTGFLKSTDIERCMREHLKQSGVIL